MPLHFVKLTLRNDHRQESLKITKETLHPTVGAVHTVYSQEKCMAQEMRYKHLFTKQMFTKRSLQRRKSDENKSFFDMNTERVREIKLKFKFPKQ